MSTWSRFTSAVGESSVEIYPKDWVGDASRPGIVFCHAANNVETECRDLTGNIANVYALVDKIVDAGYPVISCYNGGNRWGNGNGIDDVERAVNYMQTTMGAHPTKIGFITRSMGHLYAMNWIASSAARKAETSFVLSLMGVCNLAAIHADPDYTDLVNAAYGGAYSDTTHGPTYNPAVNTAAKYAGLNWQGWSGNSDTTTPAVHGAILAGAIGPTAEWNVTAGDHSRATLANWDYNRMLAFVQRTTGFPSY